MNLFAKTAPWVVASLLAATSAFGQTQTNRCPPSAPKTCEPGKFYEQGHELVCTQLPAAYNASARIDVKCAWDVWLDGSFIFWQPQQENMELGIANTTAMGSLATVGIQGSVIDMHFKYKPGFKVGAGMNFDYDNWDAHAEYTWLHSRDEVSTNGPAAPGNILPAWGAPHLIGTNSFVNASATWKFKFDFVDAEMARSYYVGRKLSFRPYVGARAAWIRQKYIANFVNDGSRGAGTVSNATVTNQSTSWGIGPRMGIGTNWMFAYGFRLFGDAEADVLYTRYNTKFRETDTFIAKLNEKIKQHHIDYLRTHLDLEMGLGWGSYFDNNNWHVDLALAYGFQVFFNQNMFRHWSDVSMKGNSFSPNGNLYVQGLTATLRVDF